MVGSDEARELRLKTTEQAGPSLRIIPLSWLTWKGPVVGAGAAGPGTPEPLGMVIYPTTGLLRKIKVAVESRRELQIFV